EVTNFDGNHYVVSIIGTNAFKYSEAKTICFDYGPKQIEPRAFYSCHNLDSISFPSSVDTLQQNICNFCPNLKYICVNRPTPPACHGKAFTSYINAAGDGNQETLELYLSNSCSTPESISKYRNHAVWGKFGNISTNFNRNSGDFCSIRDGVFNYYYVNSLSGNWNYSCTLIGIDHDSSIKNYTAYFPYHTTEIGNHAFQNSTLESIDLSGEIYLTKIGDGAFASCHSLKQVKLPSRVANIGDLAFYDCTSLTGFTVPRDCIGLNQNWVDGCSSLTNIYVEEGNSYFQAYVGESDYGEAGKHSLLYTDNGKTLYRCPEGASDVQLHHGVETIRWAAFHSCKKLFLVRLPYGVKTIRYSAFYECTGLAHIYIPSSVEYIENYAFYDCTSLKYVCLNCSVAPTAFDMSFPQNSNMELVVPDIYGFDAKSHKTKTGFKNFAKYTTNASSCWDFIDADLNRYVVTTQPSGNTPGKAVLSVYVDNGESIFRTAKYVSNSLTGLSTSSPSYRFELVGIGNHAFNVYEHPKLEWVDLRNSTFLTRIGTSALMGTPGNWSIKYIDLPSNLEVIGTNAFMHCYNLGELTIPNKVTEIGDSAFYNCSNVKTL
ncbi:MAG: leucine-rich repeat protein, partial [Muribaculaceae bacterium]|nr:leucine-rich repeat protein [Muribaculaceae bacterium]